MKLVVPGTEVFGEVVVHESGPSGVLTGMSIGDVYRYHVTLDDGTAIEDDGWRFRRPPPQPPPLRLP